MAKKIVKPAATKNYVVAKSDDGTIQITYTISWEQVLKAQDEVAKEYSENAVIPGFRKGKAPISTVKDSIPEEQLVEKSLGKILPKLVASTINEERLTFALYPKFELISNDPGSNWQVRAVTCELPAFKLGDYKKTLGGIISAKEVKSKKKQFTHEDREQMAIEAILEGVSITIPKLLVEEEVNARLSKLLERIEKLGLSLEQYLSSVGKNIPGVRAEYEKQSKDVLTLDLVLLEISRIEGFTVSQKEVDETIKAAMADPELSKNLDTPEQRSAVKTILSKRKALEVLVHLNEHASHSHASGNISHSSVEK